MMNQAKKILKNVFGYDQFRSLQEPVIANVLKKRDTLAIMPTGSGKSLCYQVPALLFKGLTIVISPLISLMKDQVEQLREQGVPAVLLNSSLSYNDYLDNIDRLRRNEAKLLYLAPETLLKPRTLDLLSQLPVPVDCLTIDEAHCISEWGHDFRPEYRQLIDVRNRFPHAVCIALTATATPRVRNDIQQILKFEQSNQFVDSFDRPNLYLRVIPKQNPQDMIIRFIKKFKNQPGIIYCATRKQVDELTLFLKDHHIATKPYHAGLADNERQLHQEMFIRDDIQVIIATIAFGMGINKSNIRFIIHYDLPRNIESYYQEIGRAGRDGIKAYCLLMFSYSDIHKIKYFFNQKDEQEQRIANIHLNAMVGFAETGECRRKPLLTYFGEHYQHDNCGMCDNCLQKEKTLTNLTPYAQTFLSCVAQTRQIFGVQHIIDVIRGMSNQRIIKFNHTQLPVYGTGKNLSKQQWFFLCRQLIQKGLLLQELEHGSLKLTPQAYPVLKGNETVMGIFQENTSQEPTASHHRGEREGMIEYDQNLFEILRKQRKEIANQNNIPPYVVFSDKSLIDMTLKLPRSPEKFLQVNGVGKTKMEKYGNIFIPIIQRYCQEKNLPAEINPKPGTGFTAEPLAESERLREEPDRSIDIADGVMDCQVSGDGGSKGKTLKKKNELIGEAFNAGQSIKELAGIYHIKENTVIANLFEYFKEGQPLCSEYLLKASSLPPGKQENVIEQFERLGSSLLKPIFTALAGQVSYDELRIMQLFYLNLK